VLSALATSFGVMLVGRALQGIGAAGPRIVTVALVRDRFEGRDMARLMSLVMSVFILVPVIAPALGQGILVVAGWRAIFGVFVAVALVVLVWFGLRLPETLPPERRLPFSLRQIASGLRETCTNRSAMGYVLGGGLVFGGFIGYLSSSAQIFLDQYRVGVHFPWYFGALALAIGAASLSNARLVMRHGMRRLSLVSVLVLSGSSLTFLAIAAVLAGHPPLWSLMVYLAVAFFCFGILFGNFNALALEQLGHIAGMAAAVVGTITTFLSLLLGSLIGQAFDGTVLPLVGGFSVLGCLATLVMRWTERGRSVEA
jgi:DHA1 family bicyclomycin/chloramphenicol resistance-like MFS transporter